MKRNSKFLKKALKALNLDLFKSEGNNLQFNASIFQPENFSENHKKLNQLPSIINTSLPTIEFLYQMFDHYNWLHFEGKLPQTKIEYSNRMLSAGSYTPSRKLIRIGRKYHEIFPDDIHDTLKHEMIHILHIRHDSAFKAVAKRIGTTLKAKYHPELRKPPKYLYECPNCKSQYPRQKRLRMASCGKCSGGKYNNRFKLKRINNTN
ncbi:MAG: hypothetical protein DRP35_09385 [Candidatus Zixiibacteriota bacterium]|nr:MAG: hypothetical protein DRP35_09385 [candidate division Zixibacteria bacterium]